jgi:site-specific DNA-methyltransferase (adenine-specific)
MIDLRLGDCLEVMKSIPSGSIDAIITDPPYGTTACKWDSVIDFELMWEQLNRIIKPNGAIVLFGSEPFSSALRMSNIKNYKYDWIWDKVVSSGSLNSNIMPMKQTENILIFGYSKIKFIPQLKKGKRHRVVVSSGGNIYGKTNGRNIKKQYYTDLWKPTNLLKFKKPIQNKNKIHPTQKPIELMEYLIKTYTNENETVLDFTMGSGSTGVAAKNTNRNFIGIEQDANYFDIATDRISKEEKQLKIL